MLNPQDKKILQDGIRECQMMADKYIRSKQQKEGALLLKYAISSCIENLQFVNETSDLSEEELDNYKAQMIVPVMAVSTDKDRDNLFMF